LLASLPVVRDPGPRALFLLTAIVTVAILLWTNWVAATPDYRGLTAIYFFLFTDFDYSATMCALLILVCAALLPTGNPFQSLLRWIGEHPLGVAGPTAVVLCAASLGIYRNHPLSMDEYSQFFQSQVFASGHLAGRFPVPLLDWLIPRGFQNSFLVVSKSTGAVASGYWPMFALLLTPFTWLGIPWAFNPVVSALTLLGIHRLALQLFADRQTAGLAVLLTVASPEFFANGISYYSMPAHLLANVLFSLLLVQPTPRRVFAAGVVGSIALTLHNPVPHMLFALPWVVWLATRRHGIRLLGWIAAGYAPLCVALGVGWFWFTITLRHELAGAIVATNDRAAGLEQVAAAFSLPTSTILLARLIGLAKIWVWAVPGLLIVAVAGVLRWRHDAVCRLFAFSALATFAGFLFVPMDQGHGWGFRYFHTAWVSLPLLAAGAFAKPPAEQERPGILADTHTRSFVVVCALLTLVFGVGFRAWQIHDFMAADLAQLPAYTGTERRVVIVDPNFSFYGADLVQNDPWLRGAVTFMITCGYPEDATMMREHFPELHRVYADKYCTVWSAAPRRRSEPREPASRGHASNE